MRLSLLSRLFKRSKDPEPAPVPVNPATARMRAERVPVRAPIQPRPRAPAPPPLENARRPPLPIDPVAVDELSLPPIAAMQPPASMKPAGSKMNDEPTLKATPMPAQEEVSIKLSEGMSSLSSLLGSIDEKLGDQRRHAEVLVQRLEVLPRVLEGIVETQRLNLEALKQLRTAIDQQSEASHQAGAKLEVLPTLLDGIGGRIEKQTESAAAVRTAVDNVGQSMKGFVDVTQRTQNSLVTEFRRGQDEQRQRLETLVDRQRHALYVVGAIALLVVIAVLAVLTHLPKA